MFPFGLASAARRGGWKNTLLRPLSAVLPAFMILFALTGCGAAERKPPYSVEEQIPVFKTGLVADNANLQLLWDNDRNCLFLRHKNSGKIWSSTPYSYYQNPEGEGIGAVQLESQIIIDYIDSNGSGLKTLTSKSGALESGRVASAKIENGLEVTYYFDRIHIAVPVQYILRESCMEARILTDRILEGEFKLYQIALLPYFASVKNGAVGDYLVVPSGSGALMKTDEGKRDKRIYSEEVFGRDPSAQTELKETNTEPIRLPVFGVKDGKTALCAIMGGGCESALLTAQAGDPDIGYSSAYPAFRLRGSDTVNIAYVGKTKSISQTFTDERLDAPFVSISYYPMSGEDADYAGMARLYRDSLEKSGGLASDAKDTGLYINLLGGVVAKSYFLGIPRDRVVPATTFDQARKIIEDIKSSTGLTPVVRLTGYGDSGLDVGKIGGGYLPNGRLGGGKGFQRLQEYCGRNGVPLILDFDILRFGRSGGGFSVNFDLAQAASNVPARQYYYSTALRDRDKKYGSYGLLARAKLSKAVKKLSQTAENWKLWGISLESLGSTAYSDYSDRSFYLKAGMPGQASDILKELRKDGRKVAVTGANSYAAAQADYIIAAPSQSGKYTAFDGDIPFYQMVFRGYVPMSGAPVNLAANPESAFLKSVMTGSGLCFTLTESYDPSFAMSPHSALSASCYDDNRRMLADMAKEASGLYGLLGSAKITGFREFAGQVYETRFDNGAAVYTNFSDEAVQTPAGLVKASGFAYTGG